jgi:integrase
MRALTVRQIKTLTPGRHYLGDGLCLIKQPEPQPGSNGQGKCRWIFRYTSLQTRRPTETSIGPYPAFTYPQARAEVTRLRALLVKDIDPVAHKREQRANGVTFAEASEGWIAKRQDRWRSTRNVKILLTQHGKPLAGIPVSQITPPMVQNALADLWEHHPEQARRALSMWARVFDYAKAMGMRSGDNPCAWRANMEYVFPGRPKNNEKHYSSLPFKSVPEFIRRLRVRQRKGTSAVALEFQILTATRPGETRGAVWSEFDLINRIWVIPPERTKQGRQHRVPLSERCMQLLALQNEYRTGEFVFTGYNHTALDEKATRVLLRSMEMSVTAHGFRSSFRNWSSNARIPSGPNGELERIPRELAELCLAHLVKGKTEGAYWTEDGLDQRRGVMDSWAAFCSE